MKDRGSAEGIFFISLKGRTFGVLGGGEAE
jgi:hypothetical protein